MEGISKKRILVIGDIMLDVYVDGEVSRISPEAPVPVFHKKSDRCVPGGAANVAINLIAAGQDVSIMSTIGDDGAGRKLKDIFLEAGIHTELIHSIEKSTITKTRYMANSYQQVMRLDIEETDPILADEEDLFISEFEETIDNYDLVLFSDYMKGLLTTRFTQSIIKICKEKQVPVVIDVKDKNFEKYTGADIIKPNLLELRAITNTKVESDQEIIEAAEELRKKIKCKYILVTLGGRGMILVGDEEPFFLDAVKREVFDVSGAGDTTIAYLATCLVNGWGIRDAVKIANEAAGIQVSKAGTSCVYWDEIEYQIEATNASLTKGLLTREEIKHYRKIHKDEKIVFTNGCFDILHVGHVRYLKEAARLGERLIIGLNSDESVKQLKGQERPINSEFDRAEMLLALEFVDNVVIFNEETPYNLISIIQPDVLVKGGDYSPENVVGKDIVENRGGELVLIPFVEGKSTTNIISRIRE